MLRALAVQITRHGRRILEGLVQKGETGAKGLPRVKGGAPEQSKNPGDTAYLLKSKLPSNLGQPAWVQKLSGTGKSTVAAELRRKAALAFQSRNPSEAGRLMARAVELATGRSFLSLYALVGFGMKAGNQQIHIDDQQLHHICDYIQTMVKPCPDQQQHDDECVDLKLSDLQLGSLIAKGCNSAVYSARIQHDEAAAADQNDDDDDDDFCVISDIESEQEDFEECIMGTDEFWDAESDITIIDSLVDSMQCSDDEMSPRDECRDDMDLAVKMMFNYDAGSNADNIIRVMENEIVPCTNVNRGDQHLWHHGPVAKKKCLDRHDNIVDIQGVFVDDVPDLPDGREEYPDALPSRINPDGYGHNRTLFLVMKRYNQTLREYLETRTPTIDESMFLFTQLLEAVLHLHNQQIAHRDLKSDNILLHQTTSSDTPELVVTDFGCCLADNDYGLQIPYFNHYMNKGGNATLMAPEIVCAEPGRGVYLDYSKSDLWAVGALAYEIFGAENPFYRNSVSGKRLDSRTYTDHELPPLPDHVPGGVQKLIKALLRRDPNKRPSVTVAANTMYMIMMAPVEWARHRPDKLSVTRWLLTVTAGFMCQRSGVTRGDSAVMFKLKQSFLSRLRLSEVMRSLELMEV